MRLETLKCVFEACVSEFYSVAFGLCVQPKTLLLLMLKKHLRVNRNNLQAKMKDFLNVFLYAFFVCHYHGNGCHGKNNY